MPSLARAPLVDAHAVAQGAGMHPAVSRQVMALQQARGNQFARRFVEASISGGKTERIPKASQRQRIDRATPTAAIQRESENSPGLLRKLDMSTLIELAISNVNLHFVTEEDSYTREWLYSEEGRNALNRVLIHRLNDRGSERLHEYLNLLDGLDGDETRKNRIRDAITWRMESASPTPTVDTLQDVARDAIEQVWGAQNQGLDDFENAMEGSADWGTLALVTAGNVIWAAAAFTTGGAAFLVSLEGIALSTSASAAGVGDRPGFHQQKRRDIDAIKQACDARISAVSNEVHEEAWDGNRARYELLKRLLKPAYVERTEGGVPVIKSDAIAASVEKDLLLKAATSPWRDWAGWEHGNAWVEYNYSVGNVMHGLAAEPRSEWDSSLWGVSMFPIPEGRDIGERLETIHAQTLHRAMDIATWPIRKRINVTLRGAGRVNVMLGPGNGVVSATHTLGDDQLRAMHRADESVPEEADALPLYVLRLLWGGETKPPAQESFFFEP